MQALVIACKFGGIWYACGMIEKMTPSDMAKKRWSTVSQADRSKICQKAAVARWSKSKKTREKSKKFKEVKK